MTEMLLTALMLSAGFALAYYASERAAKRPLGRSDRNKPRT